METPHAVQQCSLLTTGEVSAATGKAVERAAAVGGDSKKDAEVNFSTGATERCEYLTTLPTGKSSVLSLIVSTRGGKATMASSELRAFQPVEGVGDRALDDNGSLYVLKGDALLILIPQPKLSRQNVIELGRKATSRL